MNATKPRTGKELRDEGQSDVIAAEVAIHRNYLDHARSALDRLVEAGNVFTVEHVRALIPKDATEPHHVNVLPALIGGYAAAGKIRRVTDSHSTRAERRYGRIASWEGVAA